MTSNKIVFDETEYTYVEALQNNYKITLHNDLIKATFAPLSLVEQKIIYAALSLIPPAQVKVDESGNRYVDKIDKIDPIAIPHQALQNIMDVEKLNYTRLKSLAKSLTSKTILFDDPQSQHAKSIQWIIEAQSVRGMFYVIISPRLYKYVLNLERNFTTVDLGTIMRFKSKYTAPLYFIFKESLKYSKTRTLEYDVEDLKAILGVPEGSLKVYGHFKDKALNKALKDIQSNTKLQVNCVELKRGNKVIKLVFEIAEINVATVTENPASTKDVNKLNTGISGLVATLFGTNYGEKFNERIINTLEKVEQINLHDLEYKLSALRGYAEANGLKGGYIITTVEQAVEAALNTGQTVLTFKDIKVEVPPTWFKKEEQVTAVQQDVSIYDVAEKIFFMNKKQEVLKKLHGENYSVVDLDEELTFYKLLYWKLSLAYTKHIPAIEVDDDVNNRVLESEDQQHCISLLHKFENDNMFFSKYFQTNKLNDATISFCKMAFAEVSTRVKNENFFLLVETC